jgi:hypothetical protein
MPAYVRDDPSRERGGTCEDAGLSGQRAGERPCPFGNDRRAWSKTNSAMQLAEVSAASHVGRLRVAGLPHPRAQLVLILGGELAPALRYLRGGSTCIVTVPFGHCSPAGYRSPSPTFRSQP